MGQEDLVHIDDSGLEGARAILAQEEQARLQTCWDEMRAVMEKHGCQLVAVAQITPDGRVVADCNLRSLA